MSDRGAAAYTFGDSHQAAARLALVAEVFEATTRPFMIAGGGLLGAELRTDPATDLAGEAGDGDGGRSGGGSDRSPGLAIDLGCGPGHTTRLLVETIRARRTVGLDRSTAFVDLARDTWGRPAAGGSAPPWFQVHDVTRTPLPPGPADVLFCRFLMSHLERPGEVLAAWASQLRPGGVLLIDEVDWIDPRHPVLRDYLAAVAAMLAGQGQRLEVGPLLDALPVPAGVERLASRVATLEPAAAKAARMFAMNLEVWGGHPYVRSELGHATLRRLAAGLAALADDPGQAAITWGLRQLIYRRPA